jgi:hypothetical protein
MILTDYEKTIVFLDDLGIGCETKKNSRRLTKDESDYEPCMHITLEAHEHEKVNGYVGFACIFEFNMDGSLSEVGVWE